MELTEYQDIVNFISKNCYPNHLQDNSTKAARNKRDNFKSKTKKFFLKVDELYRFIPGNINGAKVVLKHNVKDILSEFHGSAFGGHSGVNKTREAIKSRYWWSGITEDIKNYVSSCEVCQKSDPLKPAKKPELQQIKVSRPFELVGVDLIGPLTETDQGNKYIFTATDYFTKWVEAFPIRSKSAIEVSKCFERLFSRHGAVNAILTDQGREFLNQVNDQLCKDWNIQHRVTAAYHPQTNGLDEKTNQTLKTTLRKMVNEHQTDWDNFIDGALFSQRTKPHSSTKFSPFFLLYGREAVYPSQLPKDFSGDNEPRQPEESDINDYVFGREQRSTKLAQEVKDNIEKAHVKQQKGYKKRLQKGRTYTELKVGDEVLAQNTKKTATKKANLEPNYLGPYIIVKIEGKNAVLKNTSDTVLKKKFNIDHLKLFHPTQSNKTANPSNSELNMKAGAPTDINNASRIQSTSTPIPTQNTIDLNMKAEQYIKEISERGFLQQLIDNISKLDLSKAVNIGHLQHLLVNCPQQSFVLEVCEEDEEEVDIFATKL